MLVGFRIQELNNCFYFVNILEHLPQRFDFKPIHTNSSLVGHPIGACLNLIEKDNKIRIRLIRKLDTDPLDDLIKMNTKLVTKLFNQGYINKETRVELNDLSATYARIHGLPKLHKEDIPLRPVVDTINSPSYALNKFMNDILKKICDESKYNIRNSYEFKDFIAKTQVPTNHILVSFDVVSLYTNTDVTKVLNILKRRWPEIELHTTINKDLFF